jgi:hypothetical protein
MKMIFDNSSDYLAVTHPIIVNIVLKLTELKLLMTAHKLNSKNDAICIFLSFTLFL